MNHQYKGLPGVEGVLEGPFAKSMTAAKHGLRHYRVVSAAGDYGALNLWIDDEGKCRGAHMIRMEIIEERIFTSKAQGLVWYRDLLPRIKELQ